MSGQRAAGNELSMAQTITALRNENTVLKEQLALVQQQYEWQKKQVFGRKSEQTSVIMGDGTQLVLFPVETAQDVTEAEQTIPVPGYKRKKKRTHDDWMSNLPIEERRCRNCFWPDRLFMRMKRASRYCMSRAGSRQQNRECGCTVMAK